MAPNSLSLQQGVGSNSLSPCSPAVASGVRRLAAAMERARSGGTPKSRCQEASLFPPSSSCREAPGAEGRPGEQAGCPRHRGPSTQASSLSSRSPRRGLGQRGHPLQGESKFHIRGKNEWWSYFPLLSSGRFLAQQ